MDNQCALLINSNSLYSQFVNWRDSMLILNNVAELGGLEIAAEHLCIPSRTAPKGKGRDLLVAAVVTDQERNLLQQ